MRKKKDRLAQYSSFKRSLPDILIASIAMNVLSLALPVSLLQVYDRIIPNTSFGTLIVLVTGVLCAILLETVLRVARGNMISWLGTKYEHRLGCAAFERVLNSERDSSSREAVGDTLERLGSLRSSREYYSGQMVASLIDIPFVVIFLGMVYILGGPIVWVPICILTLFGLVSFIYGTRLGKAIRNYNVWRDRRLNFQIEALSGIHTIKALGVEAQMEQRYSRLQDSVADADQKMVQLDTANQHISAVFAQITMVAVAAYGSTFVVDQQITVGVLAACTLLSGRAMQPFQRLTGLWSRLQNVLIARERINGIFDLPVREDAPNAKAKIDEGRVTLENVTFQYNGHAPLFEDVSLDIKAGECIGIVGGNGVGKTTLLALLRGIYPLTQGQIKIDGVSLGEYSVEALRGEGVAYLPQSGTVFNGTILDNLTMFDKRYRHKALALADGLGLNEVVAKMSQGYETVIGNSGSDSLPRGIRQRISIARALVKTPKVVLFDEANAAIDGPGDVFLREYLESLKGRTTLIMISSRPSLLRIADRAFEIKGATLVPKQLGPVPATTTDPKKKVVSRDEKSSDVKRTG
ncbi:peptidase domain-containing ABC transporter [Terasakiella pusilla]|uniref:peptidase domain-containing ABC transporter n=1 Tax=Terasakiella pusilla TaxID=64973 RepID=UPI003AA9373E